MSRIRRYHVLGTWGFKMIDPLLLVGLSVVFLVAVTWSLVFVLRKRPDRGQKVIVGTIVVLAITFVPLHFLLNNLVEDIEAPEGSTLLIRDASDSSAWFRARYHLSTIIVHAQPGRFETVAGNMLWRAFNWGITRGDSFDSFDITLIQKYGFPEWSTAYVNFFNPVPVSVLVWLIVILLILRREPPDIPDLADAAMSEEERVP